MSLQPSVPGLQGLLQEDEPAGVQELRTFLATLLGATAELVEERMIWRSRVYRARFRTGDALRSLILKRLPPDRAHREQQALRQWLPRLGLGEHGSPLVGVAAAASGETVWHVYDDLGERTLDRSVETWAHTSDRSMETPGHTSDRSLAPGGHNHGSGAAMAAAPFREGVLAAVDLVARIHTGFSTSGFLGECRQYGVDLGLHFLDSGLTDATGALESGRARFPGRDEAAGLVLERLLERLQALRAEEPERRRLLAEFGGSETLLHGDLWTCNVMVLQQESGLHIRLIDWDHAGVGYVSYDLSAFLLRFPQEQRDWVLDAYADKVALAGWELPDRSTLNALFDTAERARLVSSLLWPALSYRESGADWALEQLAEVERWFDALGPILSTTADR
jgi:hypothetical protein